MYTQDEFAERVRSLRPDYAKGPFPLKFWEEVGAVWFDQIFPRKNEIYGVEGLQRLGPMHTVAEFVGCYYRWRRMRTLEFDMTQASMVNAVHDAFGYSVLMRTLADEDPTWSQVAKFTVPMDRDLEGLVSIYWDEPPMPVDGAAVTMATRISVNMYREIPGA